MVEMAELQIPPSLRRFLKKFDLLKGTKPTRFKKPVRF